MTTHAIHYTHNPAEMEFKPTLIDQKGAAIEVTGQTLADLLEVIAMHLKAGDWVSVQEARVNDPAKTAVIGPTDITVAERASMMLGHGAEFPFDDAEAKDWAHSAAHGVFADLGDRRDIGAILHGVDGDMRAEMVSVAAQIIRDAAQFNMHCKPPHTGDSP